MDVSARYRPLRTLLFGDLYTGGSHRVRGFEPNEFGGKGVVNSNVEFRTKPLQLFSVLAGLALFYDAGGAFDFVAKTGLRNGVRHSGRELSFDGGQSLGMGLRLSSA